MPAVAQSNSSLDCAGSLADGYGEAKREQQQIGAPALCCAGACAHLNP